MTNIILNHKLAIFDIDGTLINSLKIENQCFIETLQRYYKISLQDTNWNRFTHATDSYVFSEIFREKWGHLPSPKIIEQFCEYFLEMLKHEVERNPSHLQEVLGASSLINQLTVQPDWQIAIATGGWRRSAQFKLKYIGLDPEAFPSAFAEDSWKRESIITKAIERTKERSQVARFSNIFYIGDGLWDGRACQKLGLTFIGVSTQHSRQELVDIGAHEVLPHFAISSHYLRTTQT